MREAMNFNGVFGIFFDLMFTWSNNKKHTVVFDLETSVPKMEQIKFWMSYSPLSRTVDQRAAHLYS